MQFIINAQITHLRVIN